MSKTIREKVRDALTAVCRNISGDDAHTVIIEKPRREGHGDLASNVALLLAMQIGERPRVVAGRIVEGLLNRLDFHPAVCEKLEIAGPGFINIFLSPQVLQEQLRLIVQERDSYGAGKPDPPLKVHLEFVSANPTGPLTIAHGRQAAVGDSLARILAMAGCEVTREYYLNDKGKQIHLLGISAWQRYRELFGERADIPAEGYRGDYVKEIARKAREQSGDGWLRKSEEEAVRFFAEFSAREITRLIQKDLDDFRVLFDHWTSEGDLSASGKIEECLDYLRRQGFIYEKDGALWFRTTALGDDKDRVLVKRNGEMTYFTPDIAYHRDKFERGFDRLIDLWGPDHHGYIPRMKAAVRALGYEQDRFDPMIVQLTTLFRGREKLAMSTRAGEFITLRELMDEVGIDAARYYFVRMRIDSHLNFDIELAKSRSNDNPVYYVHYVHARVCSIFKKLAGKKPGFITPPIEDAPLDLLKEAEELKLIRLLSDFPLVIERSAETLEPNKICNYLEELSAAFHRCYAKHKVISDDDLLTAARLALADGVRIVIRNGLALLGVSAPERM